MRRSEMERKFSQDWKIKRRKDLKAQREYFDDHSYCEVCLAEGRGKRLADEVHEILYRSQGGKCVPENEISTCRSDHDRMHFKKKPYLTREQLLAIKARTERAEEVVFGAKGGLANLKKEEIESCSQ